MDVRDFIAIASTGIPIGMLLLWIGQKIIRRWKERQTAVAAPLPAEQQDRPAWRIGLSTMSGSSAQLVFELDSDVILGRDLASAPGFINLRIFNAEALGVSRKHLVLRPTETALYAIDGGSTNGTRCNGHTIRVNTHHPVYSGDILTLGRLQLFIWIFERPDGAPPHREIPGLALSDPIGEYLYFAWDHGDQAACSSSLGELAVVAAERGQPERAARLFGAAAAARRVYMGHARALPVAEMEGIAAARAKLDYETFRAAWAEGMAMSLDEAVAYALGEDE